MAGGGGELAAMVGREQIDEWLVQLQDEPSSFAHDLAHVLLHERERLVAAQAAGYRGFAIVQAAMFEAQLASSAPTCSVCGDAAFRQAAERLKTVGIP